MLFLSFTVTALFSIVVLAADDRCGRAVNRACAPSNCCSYAGFCNNSPAHCGSGCQSAFGRCNSASTADPRCGSGRPKCPSDKPCCSFAGYCGTSAAHCNIGCQSAFSVQCGAGAVRSTASLSPFAQDCLDAHNAHRRTSGLPPLFYDSFLASKAQEWANYISRISAYPHSAFPYGENMDRMYGGQLTCSHATTTWYNERYLNANWRGRMIQITAANYEPVGHYLQLITPTSFKFGCGYACGPNHCDLVCEYEKNGLVLGRQYPF